MTGTPTFGPRLVMSELPIGKLFVDERYQRDTQSRRSQHSIARIRQEFRWAKFGVILVMPWPEKDGWAILDGQHRVEAARQLAIETVPALVHPQMTPEEAASVFVGVNTSRVAVHPMALHYANLMAGDASSVEIDRACREAGITIARYPMMSDKIPPGVTLAIGTIRACLKLYGPEKLTATLVTLGKAFEGQRGRLRAEVIKGVSAALAARPAGQDLLGPWLKDMAESEFIPLLYGWAAGEQPSWQSMKEIALLVMRGKDPRTLQPTKAFGEPPAAGRPNILDEIAEENLAVPFERPVKRRCQKCLSIFDARSAAEQNCPGCTQKQRLSA